MGFSSIRFLNYRNIKNTTLKVDHRQVFFVGENGQGKTNVLEAVYYLSYGSSFRTRKEKLLIQDGSDSMGLLGLWNNDTNENDFSFTEEIKVELSKEKKVFSVDGKKIQDRKELGERRPSIVFCHDDINFVQGAPEEQRWFFDQSLALYDPSYIDVLRDYRRILKQRNQSLRLRQGASMLDVFDQQLIESGIFLMEFRKTLTEKVSGIYEGLYGQISDLEGHFWIDYRSNWNQLGDDEDRITADEYKEILHANLLKQRDHDLRMGTTTSGPHRDRYIFRRNKENFVATASTGQIRLLSLILRVAQCKIVKEVRNLRPVLLLDDVLLELDPVKRQRFLKELPEYSQAFYTFLPGEPIEEYFNSDPLVYDVKNGSFSERRTENS